MEAMHSDRGSERAVAGGFGGCQPDGEGEKTGKEEEGAEDDTRAE